MNSAHRLADLPLALRCEAVECLTRDALSKVSLFALAEEGFQIALIQSMNLAIACPGEERMTLGQRTEEMLILLRGQLDVLGAGNSVKDTLLKGACFGEQTMLSEETEVLSSFTLVSVSYSELYVLQRSEFNALKKEFKKTFEGFKQAARLEAKKNKGRSRRVTKDQAGGSTQMKKQTDDKFVIKPFTGRRAMWAALLLAALIYDAFMLPVKLVFIGNQLVTSAIYLDAIADLVYIADVVLRFHLAVLVDGRLILDPKVFRKHYRAVGFRWNVVGSIPFTILLAAYPYVDARWLHLPRILRAARLFWWLRASSNSTLIERQQPSNLQELLRLMRRSNFDLQFATSNLIPLMFLYVALAHYFACAYWAVVCIQLPWNVEHDLGWDPNVPLTPAAGYHFSEWLPSEVLLQSEDVWKWYFRALYFSISTLTGLGVDLRPSSDASTIFTIIVFIAGVLVFAYITSSIVTLVNQSDISSRKYQTSKIQLLSYMHDSHMDKEIVLRAARWYDHWWFSHGAVKIDTVLKSLTPALGQRVREEVLKIAVARSSLFKEKDVEGYEDLPPGFFAAFAGYIHFEVYNEGEWVVHKGMLTNSLCVIATGVANVFINEKEGVVIAELANGDVFGEHSAITGGKANASIRAKSALELFTVQRADLLILLDQFSEFKDRLNKIEKRRSRENAFIVKWTGAKGGVTKSSIAAAAKAEADQRASVRLDSASPQGLRPSRSSCFMMRVASPGKGAKRTAVVTRNNDEKDQRVVDIAHPPAAPKHMGWSGLKHMANNIDSTKHDEQLGDKWNSALERVISGASAGISRAMNRASNMSCDDEFSYHGRASTSSLAEDSSCHCDESSYHGKASNRSLEESSRLGRAFFGGHHNPGVSAAARV